MADPARLVGLHFFNPVAKMQLIEIVRGALTSEAALARARAFAVALDRLPLDVASRPGFLVNRVLMPYLLEAVRMVEEGISPPRVDAAACDFGMPIGPIELADTVGLDICLAVAERLGVTFKLEVPASLRTHVAHKRLGKKSGEGFYKYNARGRPPRSWRSPAPEPALAERLILRLLNEAMACLREGVVQNATAVDLRLVYGAGFAPFRGGPLGHARTALASSNCTTASIVWRRNTARALTLIPAGPSWVCGRASPETARHGTGADSTSSICFSGVATPRRTPSLPPVRAGNRNRACSNGGTSERSEEQGYRLARAPVMCRMLKCRGGQGWP